MNGFRRPVLAGLVPAVLLGLIAARADARDAGLRAGEKNTALVPVPRLERDRYDWNARHEEVLKAGREIDPEIVLIGDSITHYWAGEPKGPVARGRDAWKTAFGDRRTLNLGFGWDRVQNVLWRLEHGELDGLKPGLVVILIGTNNFAQTAAARRNTPSEVAEGIREVCDRVLAKVPGARIILMGIFPRGGSPRDPYREWIAETNRLLEPLGARPEIRFLDIGPRFLEADGRIPIGLMGDYLHPTAAGYRVWAEELARAIPEVLGPSQVMREGDYAERIRVACVGDSITFGAGIPDRDRQSYPAQLGRMLGEKWDVRNFGVSGATLLRKGDSPYWNQGAYRDALAFRPHAVVIKLGTNDTKPQNWRHQAEFAPDLTAMIASFAALDTKPKIWLCRPVPAYPERWGISDERIRTGVVPEVDRVGKEAGLPVIDLYAALGGRPELFPDKIHPNAAGATIMAETIRDALTGKVAEGAASPAGAGATKAPAF